MRCQILGLLSLVTVGGCVGAVDAPSLAVRPVESAAAINATKAAIVAAPVAPAAIVALDAATLSQLETSVRAARASIAPFAKAAEPARVAVANAVGAAVSSDAWIAAQVAVSRLERSREASANALADVDGVGRRLVASGKNFDRDAFDTAMKAVAEINTDQQVLINTLLSQLKNR
jgi:hypothetical protein